MGDGVDDLTVEQLAERLGARYAAEVAVKLRALVDDAGMGLAEESWMGGQHARYAGRDLPPGSYPPLFTLVLADGGRVVVRVETVRLPAQNGGFR